MVLFSTILPTACGEIASRTVETCASSPSVVTLATQTVDRCGLRANNKTRFKQRVRDFIPNSQALLLTTDYEVKLSLYSNSARANSVKEKGS